MERVRTLIRDGASDVVLSYAVDRLAWNQTKLAVLLDEADDWLDRADADARRLALNAS